MDWCTGVGVERGEGMVVIGRWTSRKGAALSQLGALGLSHLCVALRAAAWRYSIRVTAPR
ncbi:hypothetical protein BE20_18820 [Sorangium cellulosum]|uniref:Uncharacterized protein n=1 Tax=Sorangium cellulosum TaxID=56 RepID=A0A150S7M7_SORCE|nr:hypothetical protein BE18_29040 [Sorangium cellulosum]KYF90082.1 hypothetical protein BE20_18820 [Sorangium cellulosum]